MPTGHYDHTCRQRDLTGQTIGFARVDSLNRREYKKDSFWNCTCLRCGTKFVRSRHRLLEHKEDANCGCYCREKYRKYYSENCVNYQPYGREIDSIYWGMRKRCYSPHNKSYKHYGEKGIKVCDEWLADKMSFYKWAMSNGYQPGLSLDRIDNSKGYSPDNCRWATHKQQQNNKTNNRLVDYQGKTYTVSELADYLGLPYDALLQRINSKTYKLPIDSPLKNTGRNKG